MSHFTEVKTKILDKTLLKKALSTLGFQIEESPEGVSVRGFMGDAIHADFKILTKSHYDIGFVQGPEGFEIVGDWELLPKTSDIEREPFTRALKRQYAKTAVLEMAKLHGYDVELNEENDQIEMVVTQW